MAGFPLINLPAYQAPNALNFQPITDALKSNEQNALARRGMDLQEQRNALMVRQDDRAAQSHGFDMAARQRQQETEEARQAAGRVQFIQGLPVERQAAEWQRTLQMPGFRELPPELHDFSRAAPMILSKAAEYLGPMDRSKMGMQDAHSELYRAQAQKALREAADGASGFGKDIKPYQTSDGKIWGVQAGANGDRLMHDLSNPTSPPIYVPRGRNLPAGTAPEGVPGTSLPGWPAEVQPPPAAGQPPRYPNPPGIGGPPGRAPPSGPSQRYPQSYPQAGGPANALMPQDASQPPPNALPGSFYGQGGAPANQAMPPRQSPGPLTPFRGVKQIGKSLVDQGSGRIVGDVEESIRGGRFVEEDAKAAVADIKSRNEAIQASRGKLPRLELMAGLIDRPDVYQGTGGNAVLEFKKAAQALGIDVDGVPSSEAVRMVANQFALALRNPAGGEGMPGALSDRDLAFLVSSTPGLTNTRGGNQIMVRTMIDLERYKMAENAEAARFLQRHRSTEGLAEHMQKWADSRSALSKETRDVITRATRVQYGARSGPAEGPTVQGKQGGRLTEPPPSRFSSPGLADAIPTIRGDDDYRSLQSGSQYYAPDGSLRRKN